MSSSSACSIFFLNLSFRAIIQSGPVQGPGYNMDNRQVLIFFQVIHKIKFDHKLLSAQAASLIS